MHSMPSWNGSKSHKILSYFLSQKLSLWHLPMLRVHRIWLIARWGSIDNVTFHDGNQAYGPIWKSFPIQYKAIHPWTLGLSIRLPILDQLKHAWIVSIQHDMCKHLKAHRRGCFFQENFTNHKALVANGHPRDIFWENLPTILHPIIG